MEGIGLVRHTLDWFKPKYNVSVKLTQDGLPVQGIGLVGQILNCSSPKKSFSKAYSGLVPGARNRLGWAEPHIRHLDRMVA